MRFFQNFNRFFDFFPPFFQKSFFGTERFQTFFHKYYINLNISILERVDVFLPILRQFPDKRKLKRRGRFIGPITPLFCGLKSSNFEKILWKNYFYELQSTWTTKKKFSWFASIRHKISKFQKKKSLKSLFFDVFLEIFLEFFFARKKFGMGFSTDLGQKKFFPLKFFWEVLYVFRIIYEHITRARNDPATIADFEKSCCEKMGFFSIFFS